MESIDFFIKVKRLNMIFEDKTALSVLFDLFLKQRANADDLSNDLGISKVEIISTINQLESYGLIRDNPGSGRYILTFAGKMAIEQIKTVVPSLHDLLKETINNSVSETQ